MTSEDDRDVDMAAIQVFTVFYSFSALNMNFGFTTNCNIIIKCFTNVYLVVWSLLGLTRILAFISENIYAKIFVWLACSTKFANRRKDFF